MPTEDEPPLDGCNCDDCKGKRAGQAMSKRPSPRPFAVTVAVDGHSATFEADSIEGLLALRAAWEGEPNHVRVRREQLVEKAAGERMAAQRESVGDGLGAFTTPAVQEKIAEMLVEGIDFTVTNAAGQQIDELTRRIDRGDYPLGYVRPTPGVGPEIMTESGWAKADFDPVTRRFVPAADAPHVAGSR